MGETLICRSDNAMTAEVGDTAQLLNIRAGRYHAMNKVAARIWALLKQPVTPSQIVETLVAEYEITPEDCAAEVAEFLTALRQRDLLIEGAQSPR